MSKDECCYLCNECPVSFTSLDLLEEHLCQLHIHPDSTVEKTTDAEMQDECASVESASSPMSGSPNNPQSAEPDGFPCQLCARKFADRDQLNTHHVHTHRQKPNYVCEVCGENFSIKRDKQTHMRIHAGELPQKCQECGKEFGTRQLLKKHQMWHTGKRTHVCQQCGKSFFQRGHLSQHYQIHKNVRPFACSLCEKTFIFKFDLNRHMKIHAERGYCCGKCNKSFARQSALDEHNCKKPSPKKSFTKMVASPLSDFSQSETLTLNSPSTISQQSPLVVPMSPGDVKKEQPQIADLPNQNMIRMAQMLMAQTQQRNLLNAAAQNFFIQQHQAANSATSTAANAPLNLAGLNQLQLNMLLQQYRQQQQAMQPSFHCSICAMNFDSQASYVLHCNRAHFNNGQQNLVPSPATAEQIMIPQQSSMANGLLAQILNRPKDEQYENTTTSSSCVSSPQKVSPTLTQPHINSEWMSNGMPGCLRTHSSSPPCEKCVEYQSKYSELETNYSQARAELDRLKEVMGQLGTVTSLLNLQRAVN